MTVAVSLSLPQLSSNADECIFQDAPEYMKAALDKGVKVYSNMAQYLKDYANGVTGTVKRLKA